MKVKDKLHGLEWDTALPAAFKFRYVRDSRGPDGILMSRTELMTDSGVALKKLLERGVLKAENPICLPLSFRARQHLLALRIAFRKHHCFRCYMECIYNDEFLIILIKIVTTPLSQPPKCGIMS